MIVFPLLLLVAGLHGMTASTKINGVDVRRVRMFQESIFENMSPNDKERAFQITFDGLINGNDDCAGENHQAGGNIVKDPTDDEHLALVREYLKDDSFDKTGQLRYSSVSVIEDQLVDDILEVIYSREEYVRLLNNPDEDDMADVIKEMIRIPTQTVLKQQLLHKILASRAWYEKFFHPMLENNKRQKLLNFARHLLNAHENGTLSTVDMDMLTKQMGNVAFFDRPDDQEFRSTVDKLMNVFGASMNLTIGQESASTTVSPSTVSSGTNDEDYYDDDYDIGTKKDFQERSKSTIKTTPEPKPTSTTEGIPTTTTTPTLPLTSVTSSTEPNIDHEATTGRDQKGHRTTDEHFPTGQPSKMMNSEDNDETVGPIHPTTITASTVSGPSVTGPVTTGPATTGPATTGPATTGPPTTGPVTTGPPTTGPVTTGPPTTGPVTTGPPTTGPSTTGSPTTGPATTGPVTVIMNDDTAITEELYVKDYTRPAVDESDTEPMPTTTKTTITTGKPMGTAKSHHESGIRFIPPNPNYDSHNSSVPLPIANATVLAENPSTDEEPLVYVREMEKDETKKSSFLNAGNSRVGNEEDMPK